MEVVPQQSVTTHDDMYQAPSPVSVSRLLQGLIRNACSELPPTGFIRVRQLIGELTVTPQQAAENKITGKGPKRPRLGAPPIVPWSSATLWRKIKSGEFCKPVKLSERVTAFKVEDVRLWLDAQTAKQGV